MHSVAPAVPAGHDDPEIETDVTPRPAGGWRPIVDPLGCPDLVAAREAAGCLATVGPAEFLPEPDGNPYAHQHLRALSVFLPERTREELPAAIAYLVGNPNLPASVVADVLADTSHQIIPLDAWHAAGRALHAFHNGDPDPLAALDPDVRQKASEFAGSASAARQNRERMPVGYVLTDAGRAALEAARAEPCPTAA